uniref:Uncharacterized protein n=1 Tax=Fagus sylvatica TaxID=28930 RepID=A0A2N9ILY7_FAGSY
MEELVNLLGMGLNDVRFIGIWGMGGIGKTTLARVVYERFHDDFDGSSFLANVREESGKHGGLVSLQKQLLSDVLFQRSTDFPSDQWQLKMIIQGRLRHKRVLVILDDVDQPDQLKALAGEQSWFGQGSRIIIITRDHHLLISHQVAEAQIYKVEELNNDEALKLFSRKAFKEDNPREGYVEMCQKFINYAGHLPLALKVSGSFLFSRGLNLWESALVRFKENPPRKILDVLQISFDGLEEREKNIFLDIACFFKGEGESRVTNLYDKPDIDIDVLLKKSLVTISFGHFQMHDLLQELGKEIVRGESPEEAGRRSRLWHTKDIRHVLKDNTGTKLVKGIFLNSPLEIEEMHLNAEAFSEMKNLRLLKINNPHQTTVEGNQDFTGVPYLKELILRGCTRLYKIHASLGNLKRLIQLDLNGCKCLEILPLKINLESLEVLDLSGCSRLKKLPEIVGNMSRLSKLSLRGCNVLSPTRSNKLLSFSLMQRRSPDPMGMLVRILPGLTKLDLSYCNIQAIPDVLGCLSSLKELDLTGNNFVCLPKSINRLSKLERLLLTGCMDLRLVPELPLNVSWISAHGCTSLETLSCSKFVGRGLWFLNCIKLVDCDILSAIARGHYQFQEDSFDDVIIHGSEIPIWFSHQSVGSSVNLPACKEALSRSDANGFIQINFKTKGPGLEVTKCGAHLVYNGRCVINPYEDDLDNSAEDTKIEQSRDDYVGDELAGFSGEAGTSKSNDVDVPHPKRILFPNLIERLVLCFGNWIGNLCTQGQGDSDCEEEE